MRRDALLVIVFLGVLVLLGTAGLIVLAAKGRPTDPALVGIVTGGLGALSGILVKTSKDDPDPPAPPAVATAAKVGAAVALFAGLGLAPVGCASWWARTPQHVGDIAAIYVCVAEKTEAGHDAASVALACGLENADRVIDLLKVQKAVAARQAAKAAPKPSGSP